MDEPPCLIDIGRLSRAGAASSAALSRESLKAPLIDVPNGAARTPRHTLLGDIQAIFELVTSNYISLLLVCSPLGLAAGILQWGPTPVFFLNFLVLVPLAMLLGDVTEDLALRMGNVAGGLLNATFGNITELVLSVAALRQGLLDIVADSLLGSILSNLLLVLGTCFLVGGCYYKKQTFNATCNRTCGSLLFLSCIGIAMPTAASYMINDEHARPDWVLLTSRSASIVLLICYVCYLVFQLGTHKDMFDEFEGDSDAGSDAELGGQPGTPHDKEGPVLSTGGAVSCLAAISVMVAIHSEFLTGSIEKTSEDTGIPTGFLAMIVLPIAGNACEHVAAVVMAAKNKMDLSLGIALGSSLQISLFAIPLMVIIGWVIGQPMSLDYELFSVTALFLSVVHANLVMSDGTSSWLMGVQLCAVYIIIALVYFYS